MASFEEVKENDFNLNIPRYVDTFEEEDPVDLVQVSQEIQQVQQEISAANADLLAMLNELAVTEENAEMINAAKALFGGVTDEKH